jgi:hypothetical protein
VEVKSDAAGAAPIAAEPMGEASMPRAHADYADPPRLSRFKLHRLSIRSMKGHRRMAVGLFLGIIVATLAAPPGRG